MEFDIRDVARITGGALHPADAKGRVRGISTDSRTTRSGELFVPLRGPNFDGHDFLTIGLNSQGHTGEHGFAIHENCTGATGALIAGHFQAGEPKFFSEQMGQGFPRIQVMFQYERVGLNLRPELAAVKDVNGDAAAFAAVAKQIAESSEFNVILMTEDLGVMQAGVEAVGFKRPLMYAATEANADDYGQVALDNDLPLALKADSIDGVTALSDKLTGMGLKDLVIDTGTRDMKQALEDQIALRRSARKTATAPLGSPALPSRAKWPATWTWKPSSRPCSWPSTAASWSCPN